MSDVNIVLVSGTVVELGDIMQVGNSRKRSFRIKTVDEYQGQDGSMKQSSAFVDVDLWGKAADWTTWMTPNCSVMVTGRISYDTWTTEDGTKKSKTVVKATKVDRFGASPAPQPQQTSYNPYPPQGQPFAQTQQPYVGYQNYQQGYQQQQHGGYYGQTAQPQNPYGPYATAPQQAPAPQPPPFQPPQQVAQGQQNAAPAPQQTQAPQGEAKDSDLPF